MKRLIFTASLLVAICLNPTQAAAQLSPGDLNEVHSELEGLINCEECHEARRQISRDKCLDCHLILKERIQGGFGLHANENYRDCVKCHVEHLGRDSELIWWPDGRNNFDHKLTGYILTGKHVPLDCRKCHAENNIKGPLELAKAGKDLNRTFLGLARDCLNCHVDQHRGQLGKDCLKCHTTSGWKPVTNFDHSKADFQLNGRHENVECVKCHPYIVDESKPDSKYLKLTDIKHDGCSDCHKDIHAGKFEQTCQTCHNTTGWRNVNQAEFDHSKTRFALTGKHVSLECAKCHKPGEPLTGLSYARCTDCHSDYHRGAFADRESRGECSECHKVEGFSPAIFTIEDHSKTDFSLEGGHLAIPCQGCHKTDYDETGTEYTRFTFESAKCLSCHKDPHGETISKYMKAGGCESCHSVNGWKYVSFDHGASGFALKGRHAEVSCTKCHKPVERNDGKMDLVFSGLSQECLSCHSDIHKGQFADVVVENGEQKITQCDRCHTPGNWFPDRFDHNRDAAFKLEGAHLKAKCEGCHRKIEEQGESFIWFKPIDTACKSCHESDILVPDVKKYD